MDLKEYKKLIKELFPLSDWKHKAGIQGGYFIKETDFIRYDINYGYTNFVDEFKTGWATSITFKELENIYIKAKNIDSKSGKSTLYMMNTSPDYFNGSRSVDYPIKSEADLIAMYERIADFLNVKAPQFFERFKTIDDIDKWFNTSPGEPIEYSSPLVRFNSQKGIIAAKLDHNPNYNELIEKYRNLQKGDHFAYEFDLVVEYLKNI